MSVVLDVALPFFALIFVGYAALRWGVLDRSAVSGLNAFVYWFALPVLIFSKVADSPVEALTNPHFFVAYYGSSLPIYALGFLLGMTVFKGGLGRAALFGLGASFGNVGYMGIPLLLTAFEGPMALPAVLAVTFDQLTTVTLTVVLLEVDAQAKRAAEDGGRGLAVLTAKVARGVATNPMIASVVLGGGFAFSGQELPSFLDAFCDLLGAAAAPAALFALGASLIGVRVGENWAPMLTLAALKLLAQPLLLALIVLEVWPVPPTTGVPTLILAALPSAATMFVLAERYQVGVQSASSLVLFTHLVSVVTLTGLLAWLLPG